MRVLYTAHNHSRAGSRRKYVDLMKTLHGGRFAASGGKDNELITVMKTYRPDLVVAFGGVVSGRGIRRASVLRHVLS